MKSRAGRNRLAVPALALFACTMIGGQECVPSWDNIPPPETQKRLCATDPPYLCGAVCNPPFGDLPEGVWIFAPVCGDPSSDYAGPMTRVFADDVLTLEDCEVPAPDATMMTWRSITPYNEGIVPMQLEQNDGCTPPPPY